MRSRWTNFLTDDGEKAGRDRESEFQELPAARSELLATWEAGWRTLFEAIEPLKDADLARTVRIRNEEMTVIRAIMRQVAHYAWHTGQIVLIAKHVKMGRKERWTYMTIAPGESMAFNSSKGL